HANVALAEERRRDDPHVRLARREDARAVRPDQPGATVGVQLVEHAELVVGRNPLGDRDDQLDPRVLCLEDRVRGEAGRYEDHRGVGAGALDRVMERVEHRDAVHVLSALARGHAADHLGPVVAVAKRVERPLATGDPGHAQPRVPVDQDAHAAAVSASRANSTTLAAAPSIVAAMCTLGRLASASSRRPSSSLVPSSRTTNGTSGLIWSNASIRPLATSSHRVIPPKMLNSTALTL